MVLVRQYLYGAGQTVAVADEHRPAARASSTLEPDADGQVKEVVVLEVRHLDLRSNSKASAVAAQTAVLLNVHTKVLCPDSLRRLEISVPLQQWFVKGDARDRIHSYRFGRTPTVWPVCEDIVLFEFTFILTIIIGISFR